MRRRSLRPVLLRRGWLRRSRARGSERRCLGGSWGWGASIRLIGGALYRPRRRETRRPKASLHGGPGGVASSLRSRRSRSRAGRWLGRPRGPVGFLWRGQGGRRRAGCWEEERGSRGAGFSSPPSSRAWVGAEGTGFDQGTVQGHGNRVAASWHSAAQ
jgi:hypothetical protein